MARIPQQPSTKGSQRWLQSLINDAPATLNDQIGLGLIDWRSPLQADDYAEYRDQAFLDLLSVTLPRRSLASFWPGGGPQWDALGRAASGEIVLVEAKAHLNELYSPASGASEASLARIQLSLRETRQALGVPDGFDWSKQFYQYANRLAHGFLLSVLNGVPAKVVFLYFVGASDVDGPSERSEWEAAIHTVHEALGLPEVPPFVIDAFVDVSDDGVGTSDHV